MVNKEGLKREFHGCNAILQKTFCIKADLHLLVTNIFAKAVHEKRFPKLAFRFIPVFPSWGKF